jgi:hypothetical protein
MSARNLAAGLRAGQADVFEHFGLDQGQRLAGSGAAGEELEVTLQALAGDRARGRPPGAGPRIR